MRKIFRCCFCNCETVEDINVFIPSCEHHKELAHEKLMAFVKKYPDYTKWKDLEGENLFYVPFPENLKS